MVEFDQIPAHDPSKRVDVECPPHGKSLRQILVANEPGTIFIECCIANRGMHVAFAERTVEEQQPILGQDPRGARSPTPGRSS